MKSQNTTETPSAVADLQEKWPEMNDLDRAAAIHKIHGAGTSFRQLAKALKCSPTLLRNLDRAAQAPPLDRMRARKGEISTRELVRRSRAAAAHHATKEREEHERERMKAAQSVCTAICDWLKSEGYCTSHGERIVENARALLAGDEAAGTTSPLPPAPPGTALGEIIERLRPPRYITDGADEFGLHALWLERWVFFAFPDSLSRHQALGLALKNQIEG